MRILTFFEYRASLTPAEDNKLGRIIAFGSVFELGGTQLRPPEAAALLAWAEDRLRERKDRERRERLALMKHIEEEKRRGLYDKGKKFSCKLGTSNKSLAEKTLKEVLEKFRAAIKKITDRDHGTFYGPNPLGEPWEPPKSSP